MCQLRQKARLRALTFLLLISLVTAGLLAPPCPAVAVAAQAGEPTPDPVALEARPTPGLPAAPPTQPPPGSPRVDTGYVPSGIPLKDLPTDGHLTRINARLDPRDPDRVGRKVEATLRSYDESGAQQAGMLSPPSPEIVALAAGLDNDPLFIYEYVHNNYDFVPTWGLMKSPRETYLAKAGNAFDLAALLVSLLRAAGYEAEFAFGQIRVSPEQLESWVGATDTMAALWVLWNGGIPAEIVINGFSVEHVWARLKIGTTWHPLDPSFKGYSTQQGLDLGAIMGYDRSGFLAAAQMGSTVQPNYVRDINEPNINGQLVQYGTNLADHLRTNLPFSYLHEVIGGRGIVPETLDIYPTQLPYAVLVSRGTAQEIPTDLVHKLHIELPGVDYWANLPDVAGERITVFYVPATPADQAAIDAAGGIFGVNPAHQVSMKAELRVGGALAGTGQPVSLGSSQRLDVTVVTPIDDDQGNPVLLRYAPQDLRAGQWYALPMKLQTVSDKQLHRQQQALEESLDGGLEPDSEPVLGQSLYTIGMSYLHEANLSDRLAAQVAGIVRVPFVSGLLVSQDVAVLEWAQVGGELKAKRLGMASYSVDVRLEFVAFVSSTGDAEKERGLSIATGHRGSSAEHGILEQLQGAPAISTIRVMDEANRQGLKIYHITAANLNTVLPLLNYGAEIKQLLRQEVEAGSEVTVPESGITYDDWNGTGWIFLEPQSGSTAYQISGGIGQVQASTAPASIRSGGTGTRTRGVSAREAADRLRRGQSADKTSKNDPDTSLNKGASGADPVDTGTGAFVHSTTDVAFGDLGYAIDFRRSYVSERRLRDGPLGRGWTHSYEMSIAQGSDWSRGFGPRAALDGVAAIAEAYVTADIFSTAAGALDHQRLVIGSECADWMLEQVTDNVMTVAGSLGEDHQYLLLPDGTYHPAYAMLSTLVDNGNGSYTIEMSDGATFDFDDRGRARSLSDARGNQTTLTYDVAGRLVRVTDPGGRSIDLTYSGDRLSQLADPIGRVYRYQVDGLGHLRSASDGMGGTTTYSYEEEHRLTSVTDPEGIAFTSNTYDAWGRVTRQANGSGNAMVFLYGDVQTTAVDAEDHRATYYYDRYGRLARILDENGYSTSWEYDANDHTVSATDANGGVTSFVYNPQGLITSSTGPLGHTTTLTYDAHGDLTSTTDELGRATQFTYDAQRRPIRVSDGLGERTRFEWDNRGLLAALTDGKNRTTRMTYDGYGNLVQVTDPLGHTESYEYDLVGRMTRMTTPGGRVTEMAYDANDALVTATDGLGHETHFTRDGNGLLRTLTDARGNSTAYTYNPQLSLINTTDALGNSASYSYDANEYLVGVTDPRGNTTRYGVDGLGRRTSVTDPLGRRQSFFYDGNGNQVSSTRADGRTITYEYDARGRQTRISYPDGTVGLYAYDAAGNVTEASYGSWSVQYEYNVRDQVVRMVIPESGVTIDYTRDSVGTVQRIQARRLGALVYDVSYEHDAGDRLLRIVDELVSESIAYTHDEDDRPTSVVYPGGGQTTYAYDDVGRTIRVDNLDGSGKTLSSWAYTYDQAGNPTQVTRTTPTGSVAVSYSYDAVDQLIQEAYPRYDVSYTYDAAGNRVRMVNPLGTVNYAYDGANQLLSAGPVTFTYDANGNQTSKTDGQGTTLFSYDPEDRLVQITAPGDVRTSFEYDLYGRRLTIRGPSGETEFTYDGYSVILEEAGDDGPDMVHIYGGDLSPFGNALLTASRPVDPQQGWAMLAYHDDGRGNVANLSDADGTGRAAYRYTAFGQVQAAGGEESPYQFQGQHRVRAEEAMPDLYLMGHRYYDAGTGRFLTADPWPGNLEQPLSLNRYVYALNNPLRYADPLGLRPAPVQCERERRAQGAGRAEARNMLSQFDVLWQKMSREDAAAQARFLRNQAKLKYDQLDKARKHRKLSDKDLQALWRFWTIYDDLTDDMELKNQPLEGKEINPYRKPSQGPSEDDEWRGLKHGRMPGWFFWGFSITFLVVVGLVWTFWVWPSSRWR